MIWYNFEKVACAASTFPPTEYCNILQGEAGGKKSQLFTREYFHQKSFWIVLNGKLSTCKRGGGGAVSFEKSLHLPCLHVRQDHFMLTSESFLQKIWEWGFILADLGYYKGSKGAQNLFFFAWLNGEILISEVLSKYWVI